MKRKGEITEKMKSFAYEYLKNGYKQKKAAEFAGYSSPSVAAARLMKNEKVLAIINKVVERADAKNEMEAVDVMIELSERAMFDPIAFFHEDGSPKTLMEMNAATRRLIKGISHSVSKSGDVVTRFDLVDKDKALELVGKHHKLFTDKMELDGGVEINMNYNYGNDEK